MPFTDWKEFLQTGKVVYTANKILTEDKPKDTEKKPDEIATWTCEETILLVKINNATVEDLTAIKGIGPKTAQKILEATPVESIDNLPIKPAILKRLEEWAGF